MCSANTFTTWLTLFIGHLFNSHFNNYHRVFYISFCQFIRICFWYLGLTQGLWVSFCETYLSSTEQLISNHIIFVCQHEVMKSFGNISYKVVWRELWNKIFVFQAPNCLFNYPGSVKPVKESHVNLLTGFWLCSVTVIQLIYSVRSSFTKVI